MAYCRNCGSLIDDSASFCTKCGTAQNQSYQNINNPNLTTQTNNTNNSGGGSSGSSAIAGLGIFLPYIGWFVYAAMDDKQINTARDLLVGNIIGTIIHVIVAIVVIAGLNGAF